MANKAIEAIKTRVSCRDFSERKVSSKKLLEIAEAGRSAPSACNRQIATITVVKNKGNVEKLRALGQELMNRDVMYKAHSIILVSAPREDSFTAQDCSCILENIFVAANALKIDSCWINQFDELLSSEKGQKVKKTLGIPAENRVIGSAALGYRSEGTVISVKNKDGIKVVIK